MDSILIEFSKIKNCIWQFIDKYNIVDDRKNYTKAVFLFQKILFETSSQLENVYYTHVLRPQVNMVHMNIRNKTVDMASLIVIMYITKIYPSVSLVSHFDDENTM
jgi:hypothetical protein